MDNQSLRYLPPKTSLVLDCRDECVLEVRKSLLESLQEIMSRTSGTIKLFIFSRFEEDIDLALVELPGAWDSSQPIIRAMSVYL